MDVTHHRRLEFEPEAIDQILGRSPESRLAKRRARRRMRHAWLIAPLVGVVAAAGVVAGVYPYGAFWLGSDAAPIGGLSMTLLRAMAHGKLNEALAVCPEGPASGQLLYEEEQRVFRPEAARTAHSGPDAAPARIEALSLVRQELEAHGVDWRDVTPLAFGGVRGRVLDEARMREPATALVGNIYFKSAGRVFALEVSAWRCQGAYVLLDLWQGAAVSAGMGSLAEYSRERYKDFQREPPDGENAHVDRVRHLFFQL